MEKKKTTKIIIFKLFIKKIKKILLGLYY